MVWFQCDDCGENLKKPKLQNHFRCCSASRLSCIDCGVIFTQESVQRHTQCVSEAEKYGPKDAGHKKENAKMLAKEKKLDDVDLSLGLSTKAPWSCSLCNVKATSQETLILHSQGKKHISKARALTSRTSGSGDLSISIASPQSVSKDRIDAAACLAEDGLLGKNGNMMNVNNGKAKDSEQDNALNSEKMKKLNIPTESNGNVKHSTNLKDGNCINKKTVCMEGENVQKSSDENDNVNANHFISDGKEGLKPKTCARAIKWKKLIKKTLRNAPDYTMKLKKFRKSVLSLATEATNQSIDKTSLLQELDNQIESLRIAVIEGKTIRLQC